MKLFFPNGKEILVDEDIYELYKDASFHEKVDDHTSYACLKVKPDGSFAKKIRRKGNRPCNNCGKIIKTRSLCSTCSTYAWLSRKKNGLNQQAGWNTKRPYKLGAKDVTTFLHRLILNPPKGMIVDHINGNGLDNRRENLRLCTNQLNQYNSRRRNNKTSKYRGVSRQGGQWVAKIGINKKCIYLGMFDDEEEAYRKYLEAARSIAGEFLRK